MQKNILIKDPRGINIASILICAPVPEPIVSQGVFTYRGEIEIKLYQNNRSVTILGQNYIVTKNDTNITATMKLKNFVIQDDLRGMGIGSCIFRIINDFICEEFQTSLLISGTLTQVDAETHSRRISRDNFWRKILASDAIYQCDDIGNGNFSGRLINPESIGILKTKFIYEIVDF